MSATRQQRQQRQQIQARITTADVEFLATLHPQQSEALRRAIDLARLSVDASRTTDPAAQLAYYLDRAAAIVAAMRSAAPAPTLAGSTAAPGQPPSVVATAASVQVSPAAAALTQQPATVTELTGFEGWDE